MKIEKVKASLGVLSADATETLRAAGIYPIWINDIYIPHFNRPERVQIWYGGSGSGKSDAKATELLLKVLFNPFCRVLFSRKVADTIRASQFQLFKDLLTRYALHPLFKVNEQEMRITCTANGNFLLGKGLDDVDKVKSIPDFTDIWLEEPIDKRGTIKPTDFTELNRRLRTGRASNHIHLTFNPISKESWIYKYFFQSDVYEVFSLRTTYLDNHFSPQSQIREFEALRQMRPDEYKVYALGEWGSLKQGLVFPEFSIVESMPAQAKRSGYGLDWGFYPDPTALVHCAIHEGVLYLDEIIYEQNLTSATRATLMQKSGIPYVAPIVADSNPEAIAELRAKGYYRIQAAKKGPGSIVSGIDMIKGFKIAVTRRSLNIIEELENYEWERARMSDEATGAPMDKFNHALDAVRYWVMENANAPKINIRSTAR